MVRVDGHALFPSDYVRTAVEVLTETGADNVGGVMAAEGSTPFEQAVARAMTSWLGVGSARFHTGGEAGEADTVYLGVFRRAALERVGGYDESFLRAQDWEMNLRIRRSGGLVWFTPRLRVAYRPRADVRALARQYRDYGRWRRVVMRRHADSVDRALPRPARRAGRRGGGHRGRPARRWPPAAACSRPGFVLPAGYAAAILLGCGGHRARAAAGGVGPAAAGVRHDARLLGGGLPHQSARPGFPHPAARIRSRLTSLGDRHRPGGRRGVVPAVGHRERDRVRPGHRVRVAGEAAVLAAVPSPKFHE